MKKDLLKGFTMLALIVVCAFATAAVSNSQSATKVVADIPFEFVVGNQAMPSGDYAVKTSGSQGDTLVIQSRDSKSSAIHLSHGIDPSGNSKNGSRARLVFHRYGQRYFLAEVWGAGDGVGRQLLKSRQERAIERELASISSKSESAQSTYELVELVATVR